MGDSTSCVMGVCRRCGGPISDSMTSVGDANYHPSCYNQALFDAERRDDAILGASGLASAAQLNAECDARAVAEAERELMRGAITALLDEMSRASDWNAPLPESGPRREFMLLLRRLEAAIDPRTCTACGQRHDVLESLSPLCFAAVKPVSTEKIKAALDKGRAAAEAFWRNR